MADDSGSLTQGAPSGAPRLSDFGQLNGLDRLEMAKFMAVGGCALTKTNGL
jgi:hypothetical protein